MKSELFLEWDELHQGCPLVWFGNLSLTDIFTWYGSVGFLRPWPSACTGWVSSWWGSDWKESLRFMPEAVVLKQKKEGWFPLGWGSVFISRDWIISWCLVHEWWLEKHLLLCIKRNQLMFGHLSKNPPESVWYVFQDTWFRSTPDGRHTLDRLLVYHRAIS